MGCLVCPEPGSDIDPAELMERLRNLVSTYKVPRIVEVVPYEEAPWLPSGKISKPRVVQLLSEVPDR